MGRDDSINLTNRGASVEDRSPRSGNARAAKDPPSLFRDTFAMPPLERPVFDLPLPASRWRWRG